VLGKNLKEYDLSTPRVCLYSKDVPLHAQFLLDKAGWKLEEYNDVPVSKKLFNENSSERFARVFNKLHCMKLTQFRKVLLLDIDIVIDQDIKSLFTLSPPAGMQRGMRYSCIPRGERCDGVTFFNGFCPHEKSWGHGTGINAGVLLLEPNLETFKNMLQEVNDDNHPSHCQSAGPEQDYLSRYYADEFTSISLEDNFQMHQMFNALQPDQLETDRGSFLTDSAKQASIRVFHFSGEDGMKPWDRYCPETLRYPYPENCSFEEFHAEYLQRSRGWRLWVTRDDGFWRDYRKFGANGYFFAKEGVLRKGGFSYGRPDPGSFAQEAVNGAHLLSRRALLKWFEVYAQLTDDFSRDGINLLDAVKGLDSAVNVEAAHIWLTQGWKPLTVAATEQPKELTSGDSQHKTFLESIYLGRQSGVGNL
jgi:lipopolysaccharide biosynthesis glycosyltransferase